MKRYFYVIIPSCCGEIMDDPYLYSSDKRVNRNEIRNILFNGEYKETTTYEIDILTHNIREVF